MYSLAAIFLANLPVRWWGPFEDRFPLHRMAWVSGLVMMLTGFAIAIPGFLRFMEEAAHGFNAAIGANPDLGIRSSGWGMAALPIFMFATPTGLLSTYLGFSGFLRGASAFIADDVRGDLILTGLDAWVLKVWRRTDAFDKRRRREALEGPAVPDRLVTGQSIGRPDAELVVLASRAKTDWKKNSYLVTSEGQAYRIGTPFDFTLQAGMRTAYPLTELKTLEVIRHAIPYDLPPLWRGRI